MTRRLPYVGFRPHRPGKIHLFCPSCGRKTSNTARHYLDPPTAVLARVLCDDCGHGGKDAGQTFLDGDGRTLCNFCGRRSCDNAGGKRRCDERLIKAEVKRREAQR